MKQNAKTAVLVFHPHMEASRINARLMREAKGHEDKGILVRDEYAALRSNQIDIPSEQAFVKGCDRLVWQFPMYWYSLSSAAQGVGRPGTYLRMGLRYPRQCPERQGTHARRLGRLCRRELSP